MKFKLIIITCSLFFLSACVPLTAQKIYQKKPDNEKMVINSVLEGGLFTLYINDEKVITSIFSNKPLIGHYKTKVVIVNCSQHISISCNLLIDGEDAGYLNLKAPYDN